MRPKRGKIVKITPTNTTFEGARPFKSFFTPNWDAEPGAAQQMDRVKKRTDQGQVAVAPGRGVTSRD